VTESDLEIPASLGAGGSLLWRDIVATHTLDAGQLVQLLEACRAKDRLDKLDAVLRGETETWVRIVHRARTEDYEVVVDDALGKANATANLLKQLLAALRLPDEATGKRPQRRGGGRGAYSATPSAVSSLDRARQAKTGA
jgi:hypothetical protein